MKIRKIEQYKFLYCKNDEFAHKIGTRERNDIIYVKYSDGVEVCRIYFNNVEEYVEIPYDSIMMSKISDITWTKDSHTINGSYIKSKADDISFTTILDRYLKSSEHKIGKIDKEGINPIDKQNARKQFLIENSKANTNNK